MIRLFATRFLACRVGAIARPCIGTGILGISAKLRTLNLDGTIISANASPSRLRVHQNEIVSTEKLPTFAASKESALILAFKLAFRLLQWTWHVSVLTFRALIYPTVKSTISHWFHQQTDPSQESRRWIIWTVADNKWELLRNAMIQLGPTFIKLGQYIATRPDLFGDEAIRQLSALHDDVLFASDSNFGKDRNLNLSALKEEFREVFRVPLDSIVYTDVTAENDDLRPVRVGSGCIAQVIRFHLRNTDNQNIRRRWIAMKVRHPGIEKQVHLDLMLMFYVSKWMTTFIEWIQPSASIPPRSSVAKEPGLAEFLDTFLIVDFPAQVREFSEMMRQQLDFKHEAHNLIRFRENFGGSSDPVLIETSLDLQSLVRAYDEEAEAARKNRARVHLPKPLYPFVSETILTEAFMDAIPIRYFTQATSSEQPLLDPSNSSRKERVEQRDFHQKRVRLNESVANLGLLSFLKMMIDDNFIHSDLHPGNIMVLLRNDDGEFYEFSRAPKHESVLDDAISKGFYRPTLAFLDTGLTTTLSTENLNNFLDLFSAVADGEGKTAARLMIERAPAHLISRQRRLLQRNQALDGTVTSETNLNDPASFPNFRRFERDMDELISQIHSETLRLRTYPLSYVLNQALFFIRSNHVPIDPSFTNLIVSLIIIEGLGRALNPDVDLLEAARPFLKAQTGNRVVDIDSKQLLRRGHEFYLERKGLWLRVGAFLEARFWFRQASWTDEPLNIVDTLLFNNF